MLRTLGLLFVALLVVAGAGFAYWIHQDRQARAFVAVSIPLIYKEWSADAAIRRAAVPMRTPEFEAEVREFFQLFGTQLGPLQSSAAPEGSLRYGRAAPGLPNGLVGEYTSEAKFRDGEGQIKLVVIKEQGVWRLAWFGVSSPRILEAMKKQEPSKNVRPRYDRGPPDEEAAILAQAEQTFRVMDSENPGSVWNQASLPFQESTSKRRFVAELKRMRVKERLGFYRREETWQFSAHVWSRIEE